MKKYLIIIQLLVLSNTFAQFDLGAGMGLAFFNSDDLEIYLNSNFANQTNRLNTFNSSGDFFMELGYELNENYQLGVEYNFNIYSFNSSFGLGIYDLSLNHHKPSIIGYYIMKGIGYKIKFGVGTGIRIVQAEEKLLGVSNYSTNGIGFIFKAQGDTKLSGNLYALIAGELRYDLPGEIKTLGLGGSIISLNSIGVGLKLGTVYYF
ncbi:MAG: hypothetical protein V3V16_03615 [Melioribacteraceae bacterium]